MRNFQRVCDELDLTSMPAKMRRMARARQERVNHEYQRAMRVVERLLQAHGGQQKERRPPASGGCRDERKYRDEFNTEYVAEQRMEYEESVPMERWPTLPVADVLNAERQEWSWESVQGAGWFRPAMADRSRGIGDLGMAGLNIVPRTYSGSSARVDYLWQLEMNTQDSDEDVLFRQEMRYPERGAGGFSGLRRAGAGESRASPPVQQLDVSEYLAASEAGSERGRTRHRGHQEDRPSASLEEIGEEADQEEPEPGSCRGEDPEPPASAGHHFGGSRPRAGMVADRPPMPPRHSASAPLPPRGPPGIPLPRRGESIHQPRRDRYDSPPRGHGAVPRQPQPQAGNWAGQPPPPIVGLGLEAMQGMTNAMNAIANQVIHNSGMSPQNAGWPYFDSTFRDNPAFKRKF